MEYVRFDPPSSSLRSSLRGGTNDGRFNPVIGLRMYKTRVMCLNTCVTRTYPYYTKIYILIVA